MLSAKLLDKDKHTAARKIPTELGRLISLAANESFGCCPWLAEQARTESTACPPLWTLGTVCVCVCVCVVQTFSQF